MNWYQSELAELEKGCGISFEKNDEDYYCGDNDYSDTPQIQYCQNCINLKNLLKEVIAQRDKEYYNIKYIMLGMDSKDIAKAISELDKIKNGDEK
jgi:hypothetical protein